MFLPHKHLLLMLALIMCIYVLNCLEPLPSCNPFLISSSGLTTLTEDPSATQLNPAAGEGGVSTSTSYHYSMTQLNQIELASVVSYHNNSIYAAWQTLDNADYRRQDIRFGIRYSQPAFRGGVGYKILYDDIPGYGSAKDDRLSAGFRYKLNHTTIDLGAEHPLPLSKENSFMEGDFSLHFGQQIEQDLTLAIGLDFANKELSDVKLGCRYSIYSNFQAVASWSSEPGRFGIGGIFTIRWLNIAYALKTHPELAWTHSVGISAMFP